MMLGKVNPGRAGTRTSPGLTGSRACIEATLRRLASEVLADVAADREVTHVAIKVRFVPFDGDLSGPPEQQARAINLAMEQLIAHCPAQYFWSYNRYKAPEGSGAPQDPNP